MTEMKSPTAKKLEEIALRLERCATSVRLSARRVEENGDLEEAIAVLHVVINTIPSLDLAVLMKIMTREISHKEQAPQH
jgi:hypothetical protein